MRAQTFTDVPSTRKPLSLSPRLQAGADEPRPNVCEVQKNHPNPAQPCANSSKRCIKRARPPQSDVLVRAVVGLDTLGGSLFQWRGSRSRSLILQGIRRAVAAKEAQQRRGTT